MRPVSLIRELASPLGHFWPRMLINKIAVSMALVLIVTIFALTWYSWSEKVEFQRELTIKQFRDYAIQIANLTKKYVNSGRIDELEEVVSSFMMMKDEYDLLIKDVGFNNLIAIRHTDDSHIVNFTEKVKSIAPVESGENIQIKNGLIEFWRQIDSDKPSGWICIRRYTHPLDGLPLGYLKTTISVLIISIIFCFILLRKILQEPLRSLRRAAEFSEWLDMVQGNHLQLKSNSKEVEQLIKSINKASERMFQKGMQEKRNQLLIDAIRDIQTKYIEHVKITDLNACILAKIVQVSESEYGFFGEVKKGLRGKSYLKMRNFSKLSENILMQNFIEKYMPLNMEFHNQNNLFGIVLQTNKTVIANEPLRDPRRGGLPEGHPVLHSFMAVPIFNNKKLVAVVGLANRRGGYDKPLETYIQPLLEVVGSIVVAQHDDRNQTYYMRQHEQKEVLLRSILDTVTDSVITINMGGFIETANRATEKMFGHLSEDILSQHINRLIPNLFTPEFSRSYLSINESSYHNLEAIHKDGKRFPIEFTVNDFTIGDEKLFTVTIMDISHLQHESLTLGQTEQALFDMQRMVNAGTWDLNLKNNQFSASQNVFTIFGLANTKRMLDFDIVLQKLYEEDRQLVKLAIEQCVKNNEPFVVDVRIHDAGDNNVPRFGQIQGRSQSIPDSDSKKIVGIVQDVTDTRTLVQMKDEFITSISEEIRSPLAAIRGSIGLLTTEIAKVVTEKEKFLLDSAYQISDRLLIFLNDILDIEKMATGRTEFRMEFLECDNLLNAVVDANSALAREYKIKLNMEIKSKNIVLVADRQRIVQLMSILISNAVKHSSMNSIVDICAETIDDELFITVRDQGEGIPAELHNKLFDLYARTQYFRSDHPESTGLGLCIVKSIVDRHRGSILIDSTQGEGTTVSVRLPIPQQNITVLKYNKLSN